MDAELGNSIGTALNALGFALGATSLAVSGWVYFMSRAGKVRAFEGRVYSQLTNAAARIERIESQWLEEKSALAGICDEMVTVQDRTAKERRRLYQEHQRDPNLANNSAPPTDLASLPRDEQLRQVRVLLSGT